MNDRTSRHIVLLACVLLLVTSQVYTAELRNVTPGDSCQHVVDVEAALGGRPAFDIEKMLKKGFVLYRGSDAPGSRVEALYRCSPDQETVLGYSITLSTSSERMAREAYSRSKVELQTRFGTATSDSQAFSLPQRIHYWIRFSAGFASMESTEWRLAPDRYASLTLRKPRGPTDWQVVRSDGPSAGPNLDVVLPNLRRLLADAILVSTSSAAIVAVLLMTALRRFRWLVAVGTPLAFSAELLWVTGWTLDGATAHPVWFVLYLVLCTVSGSIATMSVALLLPQTQTASSARVPSRSAGRRMLCAGLALAVALRAVLWWMFRLGYNASGPEAVGRVVWGACAALAVATLLVLVGTDRSLQVLESRRRNPDSGVVSGSVRPRVRSVDLVGVAASMLLTSLCVVVVAEIALYL